MAETRWPPKRRGWRQTITNGRRELADGVATTSRIRRVGAGRPGIAEAEPGVAAALEDPLTRGDPTSPLRWTCKSLDGWTRQMTGC